MKTEYFFNLGVQRPLAFAFECSVVVAENYFFTIKWGVIYVSDYCRTVYFHFIRDYYLLFLFYMPCSAKGQRHGIRGIILQYVH